MYTPPNPAEAATVALREANDRIMRTTVSDAVIPEHDYVQLSGGSPGAWCNAPVEGRICARPRAHPSHKHTPLHRCDICRANRGSWLDCRCEAKCESPCCRLANEHSFRWEDVPVPQFQKENP